ncbi:MAG: DNA polymerase III subunit chi [Sphingopyxis sp.]|nr:DNA polymerase III subunit chi [Sphingopyxis sp.]
MAEVAVPRVDFYRLTRDPAARVLPMLAERVLGQGERLLVVAGEGELRAAISEGLWAHKPDSFLAHGTADGVLALHEPILLASNIDAAPANGARMVALADGVWRDEALTFTRCFLLFDNSRIDDARATWRSLGTHNNVERHFWKQEGGRWVEGP